jgi:curved DNA-binding protein CbpA
LEPSGEALGDSGRSGRTLILRLSLSLLMESPFDVLGVPPDADEEEVTRAYRRRAMETHPDQGGSRRAFRAVKAAYEEIVRESSGAEGDVGRTDVQEPRRRGVSRVEYLNYEVLDDRGWSLDDGDLFEKAAAAGLDPADRGRLLVEPRETLLEAAENRGFAWPYACRGGACANCAVAVTDGEMAMPANHILPPEMIDRGIRLSCNGAPTTGELKVVYNVKHRPELDELRLPPNRFERAHLDD